MTLHAWHLGRGLAGVVVVVVGACASFPTHGPVELAPAPAQVPATLTAATSWSAELAHATRRVEPYDWAMRQADLRATLVTPRLRQAFAAERARFHGRFARDAATELLAMGIVDEGVDATAIARPGGEEQVIVLAALYVADQRHRDLAMKGSIWDVSLVVNGTHIKPLGITPVRVTPAVKELLSFVDRFDDLYVIRFPLVDAASGIEVLKPRAEPLHLEIVSALAACDVSWSLGQAR